MMSANISLDAFIASERFDPYQCPNVWPDDYSPPPIDIVRPAYEWEILREPEKVNFDGLSVLVGKATTWRRWEKAVAKKAVAIEKEPGIVKITDDEEVEDFKRMESIIDGLDNLQAHLKALQEDPTDLRFR